MDASTEVPAERAPGAATGAWSATAAVVALLAVATGAGCGERAAPTGPEELSDLDRAAVEDVALDQVGDALWVVSGTHGGTFPRLAYAFSLPGVDAGILASVTVDPSFEPGLFEPYCSPSAVQGLQGCARARLSEDGDWAFQVYFTVPPDRTPRQRPDLEYGGPPPVVAVRYEPQPLRVWSFRATPGGEVTGASAAVDERLTLTDDEGHTLSLVVKGTVEALVEPGQEVDLRLAIQGLSACPELRVRFAAAGPGDGGGDVRCADVVWADIGFTPGEPPEVRWRDGG